MRVWLINSTETVPTDPGNVRLWRMGILAEMLVSRGHEVVWWTSTFRHSHKNQRFPCDTAVDYADRYRLRFLRAPTYRRNVSVQRLWNHHVLGRKFRRLSGTEPRPDVILCSYPTLELSSEAVRYGTATGVPVILDVRDLWPDIFLDLAPGWARGVSRLALEPLFRKARRAFSGAFAVSGHTPDFVEWGIRCGRRQRTKYDRDFPYGYAVPKIDEAAIAEARTLWQERGVPARPDTTVVCFIGLINYQFELETVIRAARRLLSHNVQFVLCGTGVRLEDYQKMAADCPNVVFPGWVNAPEIRTLLRMSRLAIAPYVNRADYQASISNKCIEYLSEGLPVLISLPQGIFLDLLRRYHCGACYNDDKQLADMICELLSLPQRIEEMSRNALQLFTDRFTAGKVYGEMVSHLEEVAAAGRMSHREVLGTKASC
jgi:glycosyltransferase involved in cell wall biosynthesis